MHVKLITPEKLLFEGGAAHIQICGSQGELGVLPDHAPFISTLKEGNIVIDLTDGKKKEFFVKGGVAEIKENEVILLIDSE